MIIFSISYLIPKKVYILFSLVFGKLNFAVVNRQSVFQSSLDGFFGEKVSNFNQLKFETLEDQPDKVEMPEEENSDDLERHVASHRQFSGLKRKASSSDMSQSSGTDDEDCGDEDDGEENGESGEENADDKN